jgi:hypothetical protein
MSRKYFYLLLALASLLAPAQSIRANDRAQRNSNTAAEGPQSDPTKYLIDSFPNSIALKQKGHLLEFCPDNTCDGFSSATNVPVTTIKDFAFLYEYYFSDYTYLPDWRTHSDVKAAAARILSEPAYGHCKVQDDLESAKCILLDLSRGGKIKLIFVRYDENQRNVVPEDISKELSKKPGSQQ